MEQPKIKEAQAGKLAGEGAYYYTVDTCSFLSSRDKSVLSSRGIVSSLHASSLCMLWVHGVMNSTS